MVHRLREVICLQIGPAKIIKIDRAGEKAQWLSAHTAISEDPGLTFSTHLNYLERQPQIIWSLPLIFNDTHTCSIYVHIHVYISKSFLMLTTHTHMKYALLKDDQM